MIALMVFTIMGCASADKQVSKATGPVDTATPVFSDIQFQKPALDQEVTYLGLEETPKHFSMNQIKAKALVVQVFDMYCTDCQRAAPYVNNLYTQMKGSGYSDRVKIIGVGRGNSPIEVDTFKEKYNIEFPLFSDKNQSIVKALRADRHSTPHFMVFEFIPGEDVRLTHERAGGFDDSQDFLTTILERSGLEASGPEKREER